MNLTMSYLGRSGLHTGTSGERILSLAPNLSRDAVAFDAPLSDPIRFREAISALHDVVINDLRFKPRDKTAYDEWRRQQAQLEASIRQRARDEAREQLEARRGQPIPKQLKSDYSASLRKYRKVRNKLNSHLRRHDRSLWRSHWLLDPVITVADDVMFFECFSADESSYGCLTVDREAGFGRSREISLGTTNVDYSWDLYYHFQTLRTYRETRFNVDPAGFDVKVEDKPDYREEKIELPDGWLRGFMQLQAAMGLPMRKVELSVASVYSLLAFLKRRKARTSPRAIRFELQDGKSPRLVLEPWEQPIDSHGTVYHGPADEPIRIWGRRRLLTLARVLPLADGVDVYLLGTGLPSFWVVRMGSMRLTLGLSGWTTNDWTRGSAVEMLFPPSAPVDHQLATTAQALNEARRIELPQLAQTVGAPMGEVAGAMNQLTLRGQAIYDLHAGAYRWRQVLPMALSDREVGPPHPERAGAAEIIAKKQLKIETEQSGPRGGVIVVGQAEGKPCEALIDGDGVVRKGKCKCSWHFKYGMRNGPCRHIQALRDTVWGRGQQGSGGDWYEQRRQWAGR